MSGQVAAAAVEGRDRELARVAAALARAGRGGTLVVLAGEPGIGKSVTAAQVMATLPDTVRRISAAPLGQLPSPALWPWRQVIRRLGRRSPDGGDDVLDALDARPERAGGLPDLAVVELVADHLADLVHATPTAVHLEDIHRFDDLSLLVLDALVQRLADLPLTVVACVRLDDATPEAVRVLVQSVAGHPRAEVITLGGLPGDALESAIRAAVPAPDDAAVRDAVRLSAGNPLVALELARAGHVDGTAPVSRTTDHFARLLEARVRAVEEQNVLTALALLGRPASVSLLGGACGVPGHVVTRVLERGAAAGLVRVGAAVGPVELEHPLYAEALVAAASPEVLQHLHGRIADVLAAGADRPSPQAVERVRHLIAAGRRDGGTSVACLLGALHEERSGSPETALGLVAEGLDLVGDDVATRIRLLRTRGRCLSRTCTTSEQARTVLTEALELARPLPDRSALVEIVLELGVIDPRVSVADPQWRALLGEALDRTGTADPLRAHLLCLLAEATLFTDADQAWRHCREALELALVGDDAEAEAEALCRLAFVAYRLDDPDDVEGRLAGYDRHGAAAQDRVALVRAVVSLSHGRLTAAEEAFARSARRRSYEPAVRREVSWNLGRLGVAVATGDELLVQQAARRVLSTPLPDAVAAAAPVLELWTTLSGRDVVPPDDLGDPAVTVSELLPPSFDVVRTFMLFSACLPALIGLPPDRDVVADLVGPRDFLLEPAEAIHADVQRAVAALAGAALGDPELCRAAADALSVHADRLISFGQVLVLGPAGWFAAHALAALGEDEAALAANSTALDLCREAGLDSWRALSLTQRASLRAATDPRAATAHAHRAAALAESRGLDRLAAHAESLVRAAPRRQLLSPTQERVLQLAASGMTNVRIASELRIARSTVEKHLTQAYRRLGAPNRASAVLTWASTEGQDD